MGTETIKAWGGFCDGKLHFHLVSDSYDGWIKGPAIFLTRRQALRRYEDVRRIEISVIYRLRKYRGRALEGK